MDDTVQFASIRIITDRIDDLVAFYAQVTDVEPQWATPEFAELRWPAFTLAIGTTGTVALFGDDVARAAANRSAIVEFEVPDVDAAHERIRAAIPSATWVQPPTTMPWGNRSALLRDPDGTVVNLFAPPAGGRHTPT